MHNQDWAQPFFLWQSKLPSGFPQEQLKETKKKKEKPIEFELSHTLLCSRIQVWQFFLPRIFFKKKKVVKNLGSS